MCQVGGTLTLHKRGVRRVRLGYGWTNANDSGYLADLDSEHRLLASVRLPTLSWLTVMAAASISQRCPRRLSFWCVAFAAYSSTSELTDHLWGSVPT